MTPATPARPFEARHLQLARAAFAAIAALMITFSPDHSAQVGLAVFSGFAIATALVYFLAAWLVYPAGARLPLVLLGIIASVAGMISGLVGLRSVTLFFVVVIVWALLSGLVETIAGARERRRQRAAGESYGAARDALTVGIITLALGVGLLFVPSGYALQYFIADAGPSGQSFTLTGITIGVGIFGGYAAIVAVYLAIAGFSPRRETVATAEPTASASPADQASGGPA